MTDYNALTKALQTELDEFFVALKQKEEMKKWLEHPLFCEYFQNNENDLRRDFTVAVERYQQSMALLGTSSQQEDFRAGTRDLHERNLRIHLDACKTVAESCSRALLNAFGAIK
jgi:hypothetical protein